MTDFEHDDDDGQGLRHYLAVVSRRRWIVVGVFVLALVAAILFTLRQPSEYKAQTTIVVGQSGGLVQPQNANAIQPFSATMQELIKSSVVARGVISALRLDTTPEQLLSRIGVSFNPESAALKVSVVDRSPAAAKAIVGKIGGVFSNLVTERFGKGTPASANTPATPPLTATVWDPAHVIPGKVQPNPGQNLIIAGVLGLFLGLLAAFLRDYFDRTLRTTQEIEQALGIPVIGQIPVPQTRDRRPHMLLDGDGPFEEAFYTLRTNLQYIAVGHPLRRILVTSSVPDEGKTTVCANLALAFAQSGASVAVLETDLRRPNLSSIFDLSPFANGLTSVLVGRARLQDAIRHVRPFGVLDRTGSDRDVALLSSGPVPPNPSELVGSTEMRKVVDQLSEQFDSIILDSPPILLVADAVELAKLADGVIVVVRANQITRDTAREVRALADRLDIELVGAVVTGVPPRVGYSYPHSYEAPSEGTRDIARVRTSPERVSLAARTHARRRKPDPARDRAAGAPEL